jgi:ABC-2 type transport system permease protein
MTCLFSIIRKEFRHMLRDPWTLVGVTVGAAILVALMAYTFSADINHVPVAVVDFDRTPQSRAYLQNFANDPFFDLQYGPRSQTEASKWVKSSLVRAAIIIPPDFAKTIQQSQQTQVQVVIDGSEPNTTHQILGNIEAISANHSVELLAERLARVGVTAERHTMPFEFRVKSLYNPTLEEINSILPGLMAIVLAMPALAAALSLAKEKESGSLEGLMATPIRRYQLLLGKVVPYLVVGLIDIFLFILIGAIFFGVPFRGRLTDLLLFSSLFLTANMGIALLVASLVRTQMAALVIAGLIFLMPTINEAGIFYPLYAMSADSQVQSMLWPATHYVIIARGIFLKGIDASLLISNGLFLLAIGLVINALAVWRLKKKLTY